MYLDRPTNEALLRALATVAPAGSRLALDYALIESSFCVLATRSGAGSPPSGAANSNVF
jgi:hypothetical protein